MRGISNQFQILEELSIWCQLELLGYANVDYDEGYQQGNRYAIDENSIDYGEYVESADRARIMESSSSYSYYAKKYAQTAAEQQTQIDRVNHILQMVAENDHVFYVARNMDLEYARYSGYPDAKGTAYTFCYLEPDAKIQQLGYNMMYDTGIVFTFDNTKHEIWGGINTSSEEELCFINPNLNWLQWVHTDLSKEALAQNNLSGEQRAIADTFGSLSINKNNEIQLDHAKLVVNAYTVPNAMYSGSLLHGLGFEIILNMTPEEGKYPEPGLHGPGEDTPNVPDNLPVVVPEEEILEGEVPLTDLSEVVIPEGKDPQEEMIEEIPLAELPKTGQQAIHMGFLGMAFALFVVALELKKKQANN